MNTRTVRARIGQVPYYVPRTCKELRTQLRAMGVTRINKRPLGRIRKAQLLAVFHAYRRRPLPPNDGYPSKSEDTKTTAPQ